MARFFESDVGAFSKSIPFEFELARTAALIGHTTTSWCVIHLPWRGRAAVKKAGALYRKICGGGARHGSVTMAAIPVGVGDRLRRGTKVDMLAQP
jgi:hypothetical protein